jgi:hypothetical protein
LSSADELLVLGPLAVALAGRAEDRWLAARADESMAALADEDLARLHAASDWRVRRAAYKVALADDRLDIEQLVRPDVVSACLEAHIARRYVEAAALSQHESGKPGQPAPWRFRAAPCWSSWRPLWSGLPGGLTFFRSHFRDRAYGIGGSGLTGVLLVSGLTGLGPPPQRAGSPTPVVILFAVGLSSSEAR